MKKIIFSLTCFVTLLCVTFSALAKTPYLVDDEGILTASEAQNIDSALSEMSEKYGMDFVIVTSEDFDGKGYGDFKAAVAEAVVEELRPFKAEFNRLVNDKAYLNECARNGAEKASRFAQRTLSKAMKKSGLYQL